MQLTRFLLAATALLAVGAFSLPADAQQRQNQRQQQQPAPPPAPQPPPLPQMGPNSFALAHAVQNRTQTAVEVVIRMDGNQVFVGKLDAMPERPIEGEEPPTLRSAMALPVEKEGTVHFWEIVYTALPEEDANGRRGNAASNEPPAPPKQCRQAWTGVFSPGASQPQLVAPPQQVNKSGQCDYAIAVTPTELYEVEIQLTSAPR